MSVLRKQGWCQTLVESLKVKVHKVSPSPCCNPCPDFGCQAYFTLPPCAGFEPSWARSWHGFSFEEAKCCFQTVEGMLSRGHGQRTWWPLGLETSAGGKNRQRKHASMLPNSRKKLGKMWNVRYSVLTVTWILDSRWSWHQHASTCFNRTSRLRSQWGVASRMDKGVKLRSLKSKKRHAKPLSES